MFWGVEKGTNGNSQSLDLLMIWAIFYTENSALISRNEITSVYLLHNF